MDKRLKDFFESEMYDEMYEEIKKFLLSCHIKEGKFEGNEILLNKLNRDTVIVYQQYELKDGSYDYSRDAIVCHIPVLIKQLEEWKSL